MRNMQGYQQRLVVFILFITVSYAKPIINIFGDAELVKGGDARSTIYTNQIELWAKITDCIEGTCKCEVYTDGTEDDPLPLHFSKNEVNLGSVTIPNLQPNTSYSFTLSCIGDSTPVTTTRNITTDYGRPLAPTNITVSLYSKHLQVTWLPPSIPLESFSYYNIKMDNKSVSTPLNNETSYAMSKEYAYGTNHTFTVVACYVNKQKTSICSNSTGTQVHFFLPTITTTTTTTTTTATPLPPITAQSTGVHSYSISISLIIFSLFLINKMKW